MSGNLASVTPLGPESSARPNCAMLGAATTANARTAPVSVCLGGTDATALWKGVREAAPVTGNAGWPMMATGSASASTVGMVRTVQR